jgi:hypothetical protein
MPTITRFPFGRALFPCTSLPVRQFEMKNAIWEFPYRLMQRTTGGEP